MLWTVLNIFDQYLISQDENSDYKIYDYLPLTGTTLHVILIDIAYVSFVFKIGPWLMRNRQPYQLKYTLMIYNILQIVINSIMFLTSLRMFSATHRRVGCIEKLPQNHHLRMTEVYLCYMYYTNKFMDYADTIFFVLRKSYRQVTFLHVYHHIMMTTAAFLHIHTAGYGGHASAVGVLNSFVHIVMYTYYLLSAMSPELKKSVWWKRHITEIQIIQFGIILVNQIWPLLTNADCKYSKFWSVATSLQGAIMLFLFGNFYKKSYLQTKSLTNENKKLKVH